MAQAQGRKRVKEIKAAAERRFQGINQGAYGVPSGWEPAELGSAVGGREVSHQLSPLLPCFSEKPSTSSGRAHELTSSLELKVQRPLVPEPLVPGH